MKKILVITPFFYPHIGGSEAYMEGLYSYIKEKHPEIGVDVLCYNTEEAASSERYKGMNIYRIPGFEVLRDQFALPNPFSLLSFLLSHRDYDLIHTSTRFFDSSWWAPFYAKLTGTRIVLTDHCAYHPVSKSKIVNLIARVIEATIVKFSLHFYDGVFSENKKTREFLKDNFGINSKVAYPGLSKKSSLGVQAKNKRIRIVYIGRLIKSKGVKDLLGMAKDFKQAEFVFAGDGELLDELKTGAKRQENVRVLGGISHEEVLKLLKSFDIFAYPSFHSEGLPMAIVEAGSMGLAVIATDSGAINEAIINNKTGILVKPKDTEGFKKALGKLVESKTLRQKLSNSLYEYTVKNFSWERASDLVLQNLK